MARVLTALWNWLWGEQTTPRRDIVVLEVIKTWADHCRENRQNFVDLLSEADALPQYTVDQEINAKVSIYSCDITSLKVDGIVRSTDASLTSTEGISGAIKRAAGSKLNAELMSLGGCRAGQAKTTSGFDLPAKYIVHTVGTKHEFPDVLESCYKSCLEQMKAKNMKSLAFCCISTGIQGYPNDKAALVALKTVRLWLEDLKKENKLDEIDRIVFCLFSDIDEVLYSFWMPVFFPGSPEPEAPPVGICPPNTVTSTPEVDGMTSGQNSRNIEDSIALENSIQLELKMQRLRPLSGFIEITTEPDMISLDDDPNTKRAKMPCGHVIACFEIVRGNITQCCVFNMCYFLSPESMTEYCRGILDQGKYVFPCPDPGCNAEWQYFLIRHVACLTPLEMQEFEKKISENHIKREEESAQRCPGCDIYCTRKNKTSNCVECLFCSKKHGVQYFFCWKCLDTWKGGNNNICGNTQCREIDNRIQILADCPNKLILDKFDAPSVRGCPKCGMLIEYLRWCTQMHCRGCGHYFCFLCLEGAKTKKGLKCAPYESTCRIAPRQTELPGM